MANEQVVVEIVLDDGSIQRGWAKFSKAAGDASNDSKKKLATIGDVLDGDVLKGFTNKIKDIPIGFAGIAAGAVAAGLAIKAAFDFSLAGEQAKSVEAQFQNLASSVGLAADQLEAGLIKSADGLIDNGDLLKIANSAIIQLGDSASKLPQILDLARLATEALGGSVEDRFSTFVKAIETGNTRLLRTSGLLIDQKKAFDDYALSAGVAAGSLSKAQEQQALLNAVLDQGNEKFKNTKTGLNEQGLAAQSASVALRQLIGDFQKFTNTFLGPVFASALQSLARNFRDLANAKEIKKGLGTAATEAAGARAQIISLEASISNLRTRVGELGNSFNDNFERTKLKRQIDVQIQALREAQAAFASYGATVSTAAAEVGEAVEKSNKRIPLTAEQVQQAQDRANQILAIQLKASQEEISLAADRNKLILDEDLQREQDYILLTERFALLQTERELALSKVDSEFSAEKGFTNAQREQAELATIQSFNAKVSKLNDEFTNEQKKKYVSLASVAKGVFQNQLGSAFQAFGAALAKGEDAGKAFQQAIIGIFGDIAIQLGNFYIAKGIALSADPTTPGSGVGLIAAGAALNVLGGALKASAGQGAGGGTSAGSGVGSDGASPVTSPDLTSPQDLERTPNQGLVVNVYGDILDGDEATGKRLVDLMNSAFDAGGVSLRRGLA